MGVLEIVPILSVKVRAVESTFTEPSIPVALLPRPRGGSPGFEPGSPGYHPGALATKLRPTTVVKRMVALLSQSSFPHSSLRAALCILCVSGAHLVCVSGDPLKVGYRLRCDGLRLRRSVLSGVRCSVVAQFTPCNLLFLLRGMVAPQ